ncbi:MAG: SUMF1/EgtB/PvdO family nonheme iron enzyme [Gammaproteobacteria bacterium]
MRPFEEREALLFFGRDAHVRDLVRKFAQQRFTAVIGISGSGKSSLVRAGLIPALHSGDLSQAGHRWNVFLFKPGNAPLANLAKELVRDERWVGATDGTAEHYLAHALAVSPRTLAERYRNAQERFAGEAVLLVVDQFEEIFRYRRGDQKEPYQPRDQGNLDEAEAFVKLLLRSAAEPEVPIYVLITMRTDFLGQCSLFYGLPDAINSGIYLTPRLDRDQLTSVIASPLALADGSIDGALVGHLINTLGDEDELPVLEHALLRMWQYSRETGRTHLDESDFEAMCPPPADPGSGEAGADQTAVAEVAKSPRLNYALDSHASEIYDRLTPAQQRIARRLFLALSERREGQDVRRPQRLRDLLDDIGQESGDDVLAVIDAFRAEGVGFLMPPAREGIEDGKVIDISHESLIRQWRYFQRWLREEQADVAELREWQHRAAQNRDAGGGWLDENDAARAGRWRDRIEERGYPKAWLKRYFPSNPGGAEAVFGYIDESARRVREDRENRERLEREAKEAEIKRLEAEARLQQEMAANSERERVRAEDDKRRAEASARTSRRVTRVAMASTVVVGLVAAFVTWLWWEELTIEHGRAKVLTWLHRYHIEPEMVEIPAGSFQMGDLQGTGDADEKPVRKVEFQRPFAIGKHEVTFAEYERYLYAQGFKERNFPSDQGWGRERRPVINVSWDDAVAYPRWLSKQTGKRYRLPTEAEWEYAARGGTTSAWFWSDDASHACTYGNVFDRGHEAELKSLYRMTWESVACEDGYAETAPVGSFKANAYGVHDTAGNVWEWVCCHKSSEGAPLDGSAWKDDGCGLPVLRGGSWTNGPRTLRASNRNWGRPGIRLTTLGFRLAQDL